MSDDTEWGPWIGWNGGECPVDKDAVVDTRWKTRDGVVRTAGSWMKGVWEHQVHYDHIIAYRVKKEPVIEVSRHTAKISVHFAGGVDDIMGRWPDREIITEDATCTYRDGKLISINWEAPDA